MLISVHPSITPRPGLQSTESSLKSSRSPEPGLQSPVPGLLSPESGLQSPKPVLQSPEPVFQGGHIHSPRFCPNPFILHVIMWGFDSQNKPAFLYLSMRSRMPRGACMKFTKKIKGFSRGWPFFPKALYFLCKLHTGASRHPRPRRELQKRSFVSWIKASHYDVEGKRVWTRSRGMNTPNIQWIWNFLFIWRFCVSRYYSSNYHNKYIEYASNTTVKLPLKLEWYQ